MEQALSAASGWVGLLFACGACAGGVGAALARSLFAMSVALAATSVCAAGVLMSRGAGEAALAQSLFGLGLAPFILMCTLLLTSRAAKARRASVPWAAIGAAVAAVAAILAAAFDMVGAGGSRAPGPVHSALGLWATPLFASAAIVCLGCIGFGERGAFSGHGGAAERKS